MGESKCGKTQDFEVKSRFFHSETIILWTGLKVGLFLRSFAELSSLMPYIVRVSTKHVGKDICLQAKIHFLRVIFWSHSGTKETQQCECKESKHPSKKRSSCGALNMRASARNENIPARNVITSHPSHPNPNCCLASNTCTCATNVIPSHNECYHIPSHPTPTPTVAQHQPC